MSCEADATRRVVTLEAAAGATDSHSFTTAPLSDSVLVVTATGRGYVTVDVTADGTVWGTLEGNGWLLGDHEDPLAVTIPRAAAGVRLRCGQGVTATATLAVLEP